jgi:hypothetical protein
VPRRLSNHQGEMGQQGCVQRKQSGTKVAPKQRPRTPLWARGCESQFPGESIR